MQGKSHASVAWGAGSKRRGVDIKKSFPTSLGGGYVSTTVPKITASQKRIKLEEGNRFKKNNWRETKRTFGWGFPKTETADVLVAGG